MQNYMRVQDKWVRIGERLDVEALVQQEAMVGYKKIGVVVCGLVALCDDVCPVVAATGRHGLSLWELEFKVDVFLWEYL